MIPIRKYHGCGNDFLIIEEAWVTHMDVEKLAIQTCDRHTGIGADGLIVVKQDPLEMVYYNCDGTRAPMCGNGIRCFARYVFDEGLVEEAAYDVETLAGCRKVKVISKSPFLVEIQMGKATDDPSFIHTSQYMYDYPLSLQTITYHLTSCFIGTVHTVVFVKDAFDPTLAVIGKQIHEHPIFKEKTNVNFVEVVDRTHIRVQTYERGVGMTLACGTGCCAALYCAWMHGYCDKQADIVLRKGSLHISIDAEGNMYMKGPAIPILKGIWLEDDINI